MMSLCFSLYENKFKKKPLPSLSSRNQRLLFGDSRGKAMENRTAVNYRQKNVNWKLIELLNINAILANNYTEKKTAVNYR